MLSKTRITINVNESLTDYYYDIPEKYILDGNMMFAFGISANTNTTKAFNEIKFNITQNELLYNETAGKNTLTQTIKNLSTCESYLFDPTIYEAYQKDFVKYTCLPSKRDIYVKGSVNAYEYSYVTIDVYKDMCADCYSLSDFLSKVNYLTFILFVQTPYVDFQDVDHPIKIKGEFRYMNFNLDSMNGMTVAVSEDIYDVEDSYFFPNTNKGKFFSVYSYSSATFTNRQKTAAGVLGSIMIKFQTSQKEYNVKIYNFYDLIAQIGGIYEILFE